ncbi:histidine phosphatase family protein [Acanthopleuribacter pedis]|uniref:Histidine phosphatase family protein n=1 Tax=Acanthopleuribacter pedis TaxID=442870 RepID=A0A8J7QKC3_9BACT|nr:histidine phosphatase family protein [Acanthopleuribacter pedis]MBO1319793.1 histidine phosphatase family protein [Acanthopleuribacter pedis]
MERKLNRRLLLIRHGQAVGNARHLFLGISDDPLTDEGREQARSLAKTLETYDIAAVYTSPLRRAAETTALIFGEREVTEDARLVEQDFGKWECLDFDLIQATYAEDFARWQTGDPSISPSGGEPLETVSRRMGWFLDETAIYFKEGETVAVVGHAASFQAMLCRLLGTPLRNQWPYRLENATIAEVEIIDDRAVLTKLNVR